MKTTLSLALISSIALLTAVRAADTPDVKFAKEAAMGGMMEVKAGQLASENAASPEVKDFGTMMVTDHTKIGDKLTVIATGEKIDIPIALDAEHQAVIQKLSQLKGAEFDKAYVPKMIAGHEKTLALFKTEAKDGKDAQLKTFASENIPTIQAHLDKIKAIKVSMK